MVGGGGGEGGGQEDTQATATINEAFYFLEGNCEAVNENRQMEYWILITYPSARPELSIVLREKFIH